MATHTGSDAGDRAAHVAVTVHLFGVALSIIVTALGAWQRRCAGWFSMQGIGGRLVAMARGVLGRTVGFCWQRQDERPGVNADGLRPAGRQPAMQLGRNPISDMEAIAGSPQLPYLAEVLDECDPAGPRRKSDPASLLVFAAGCWAFGSASKTHSLLQGTPLWELLFRPAAARAGYPLPEKPPTVDQVRGLLKRNPNIGYELRDVFTQTAVSEIARPIGLLQPRDFNYFGLRRDNTIYGDGSIWGYHSDLTEEDVAAAREAGLEVAKKPRIRKEVTSLKEDTDPLSGPPVLVVGAHGGPRLQRVTLAVSMYPDGAETRAALEEIERVKHAAGAGVHFLSYDRLLKGILLEQVLRMGIAPLVQMESAPAEGAHILIPERFRVQAGKTVKSRAKYGKIITVDHPGVRCRHELWGIDGWVVTVRPGLQPHWESPRCEHVNFRFQQSVFGYDAVATLNVPCSAGDFQVDLQVAASREAKKTSSVLNVYRPYPDGGEDYQRVKGWRSDAESSFRDLKGAVPLFGRATRHEPSWFQFDLIGAGLYRNAIAWDVHSGGFTDLGRMQADAIHKQQLRNAA